MYQALLAYFDRMNPADIPPMMYARFGVRTEIALDMHGKASITCAEKKAPLYECYLPTAGRWKSSQYFPTPGCGNAEYVLGIGRGKKDDKQKVAERHKSFVEQMERCYAETKEPLLVPVLKFLATPPPALPDTFDPEGNIVFTVNGQRITELKSVQEFWAQETHPLKQGKSSTQEMHCLACNTLQYCLTSIPFPVRGVPGATNGTSLVAANSDGNRNIFNSYGLTNSLIAPLCLTCAYKVTIALSDLLHRPETRLIIEDIAHIFWATAPTDVTALTLNADELATLYASYKTSSPVVPTTNAVMYHASLSDNARLVVRNFRQTPLQEQSRNIMRYLAAQRIIAYDHETKRLKPRQFSLYALATASLKRLEGKKKGSRDSAEIQRNAQRLIAAALDGEALPTSLIAQVLHRVECGASEKDSEGRSDPKAGLTAPRLALMKMYVLFGKKEEVMPDEMVELDMTRPEPAYKCGVLVSTCDHIQRFALPEVRNTIRVTHFGRALQRPQQVLCDLTTKVREAYLPKIKRAYPASARELEKRVNALWTQVGHELPRQFSTNEQCLFCLGFAHNDLYEDAQAELRRERRAQAKAEVPQTDEPAVAA